MIHVPCWCPTDEGWKRWAKTADKKIAELKAAFTPEKRKAAPGARPVFTDYYSHDSAKRALLDFFHNKCAYCESRLTMKTCRVEHYRPKGKVTDASRKVVGRSVGGKVEPHLGYYWLVYKWENLLPACLECNEYGDDYGKWDRFPVREDRYGYEPGEETAEQPLLLNPWWHCPDRHFVYSSNGAISGVTEEGRMCIEIFGLRKRDTLREGRQVAYDLVKKHVSAMMAAIALRDWQTVREQKLHLDAYIEGRRPFSAAGRTAFREAMDDYKEQGFPPPEQDHWPRGDGVCVCRSWPPEPPQPASPDP